MCQMSRYRDSRFPSIVRRARMTMDSRVMIPPIAHNPNGGTFLYRAYASFRVQTNLAPVNSWSTIFLFYIGPRPLLRGAPKYKKTMH